LKITYEICNKVKDNYHAGQLQSKTFYGFILFDGLTMAEREMLGLVTEDMTDLDTKDAVGFSRTVSLDTDLPTAMKAHAKKHKKIFEDRLILEPEPTFTLTATDKTIISADKLIGPTIRKVSVSTIEKERLDQPV